MLGLQACTIMMHWHGARQAVRQLGCIPNPSGCVHLGSPLLKCPRATRAHSWFEVLLQMMTGLFFLSHRAVGTLDAQMPLRRASVSGTMFSYRFAQACDTHQVLFQTRALAACRLAALRFQKVVDMENGCPFVVGCTVISWAQQNKQPAAWRGRGAATCSLWTQEPLVSCG